jgi:hypothetical protein
MQRFIRITYLPVLLWLHCCCIHPGCLGLAFFNATAGSKAVLRHMLHHAQRNMHLMFDDQQALNHQLVMVSLKLAASL